MRKLLNEPGLFFRDMLEKQRARLTRSSEPKVRAGSVKGERLYSVVAAVYNVDAYLDDFFSSMTAQSLDFGKHIELIMVDDGSTDRSAQIIRRWQRKYPASIRYIRKDNGGQATARNLGLEWVRGSWVTFIDPDDFVDAGYFAAVEKHLASIQGKPALISSRFIFYHEDKKAFSDTHPLKYRFSKGTTVVDYAKPTKHIQLSCNSAFFDAALLLADKTLRMDERIRPNFEDAHFVNTYLAASPNKEVVFLATAKYYYRKRSTGASTLDTAWEKPGLFGDVLEHGVLDMLRRHAAKGAVPGYAQRVALYHMIWYFRQLMDKPGTLNVLDDAGKARFLDLTDQIFSYIDRATIMEFELGGTWWLHRVGLLSMFGKAPLGFQRIYFEDYDPEQRLLQVRYFTAKPGFEAFVVDGVEVVPTHATTRAHLFVGREFAFERLVWIAVPQTGKLSVALDIQKVELVVGGVSQASVEISQLRAIFDKRRSAVAGNLPRLTRLLRWLAGREFVMRRYGGAWALADRDVRADDNAEHLYRYIQSHEPGINAYFLLRRNSLDWARLRAEGFRLVPFGGLRHRLLLLNCAHLISSHADAYMTSFMHETWYRDMLRYRFTFLQHGVIHNDLSHWMNGKRIDCFVTSAEREAESISGPSRYKFSSREVVLTGLPRHDELVLRSGKTERVILVMPTWRKNLVGSALGKTNMRGLNPDFESTDYFREWSGLLRSDAFGQMAKRAGYRIIFHPHPNIRPYLSQFGLPSYVEVLGDDIEGGMQSLFKAACVMVTDYSSVAFDMALMRKAVIYFQFDAESLYDGTHIADEGYFHYGDDGFGPVCRDWKEVLSSMQSILGDEGRMPTPYALRAEAFFRYRDGGNCARVVDAVQRVSRAAPGHDADEAALLERARAASAARKWTFAEGRWEALEKRSPDATLELIRAKRQLGKLDEALSLACERPQDGYPLAWKIEYAELLSAKQDWEEAAAAWIAVCSELEPEHRFWIDAMLRRIEAHVRSGNLQRAMRELRHLPDTARADANCRHARVHVALRKRAWDEAVGLWETLPAQQTKYATEEARLALGWAYYRLGRKDKAGSMLAGLLKSRSDWREARQLACRLALDGGEPKKLAEAWERLLVSAGYAEAVAVEDVGSLLGEPMSEEEQLALARALRQHGKPRLALALLQGSPALSESLALAGEFITCAHLAQDWPLVVDWSRRLLGRHDIEDQGRLLRLEAEANLALGNLAAARTAFEAAVAAAPDATDLRLACADVAYATGDFEEAASHWFAVYDSHRQRLTNLPLPEGLVLKLIGLWQAIGEIDRIRQLLCREAAYQRLFGVLSAKVFKPEDLVQCAVMLGQYANEAIADQSARDGTPHAANDAPPRIARVGTE